MARSSQPRSMSARQVVFYYERKPEITSHSVATMDHKRHADSEKEILQIEKETLQTRKKTQTKKKTGEGHNSHHLTTFLPTAHYTLKHDNVNFSIRAKS